MQRYNPAAIEPKWQSIWADDKRYQAVDFDEREKFYISCMFPYPSGAGMHTGHAMEHAIVDAVARFQRAHGKNVMNPMGWDAFGLPAENYAIKTGTAPAVVTKQNIENFRRQLTRMGASLDWSREVNTSDPDYYRWTQWIFVKLFERGLAYQKESLQWWCPVDKTVLANEQVEGGKCWRCGTEVVKKSMKQWFFKITDYADTLLAEIPALDWPDKIKTAQTNWIGRSQGAEVTFEVAPARVTRDGATPTSSRTTKGSERDDGVARAAGPADSDLRASSNGTGDDGSGVDEARRITVFTTRPDTIFGATFLVLAPEHPLSRQLATDEMRQSVERYIDDAVKKSEIERSNDTKEKTGVWTGSYAVNPATGENIPIWIADYVLGGYGTGAIMAVPAHDERDHEFAEKFKLPIIDVISGPKNDDGVVVTEGTLQNSGVFDGMPTSQAREEIVAWLEQQGTGHSQITYKMRDWLISRQRYWGAPIPIVHCPDHGAVAVPEDQLPVLLPEVEDFAPKGDGKSPLARQTDWMQTTCPTCGGPATRETDVMDGYACSSWYLLRYTDPHNDAQAWDPQLANYWMPLDMYVGGDHAVAHLLYVRFWNHVFYDMGLVPSREPVGKLVYHGLIQAEDGRKMSKSYGNVVDPLDVIDQGYGADALRTFELFLGPINENSNWSSGGIAGVYRFLNRIWTLVQDYRDTDRSAGAAKGLESLRHATIKKVTTDFHRLSFNTAIAALMEYVNQLYKQKADGFSGEWQASLETLVQLVQPFAPHLAAELWQQLGHDEPIDTVSWPTWDDDLIISDSMTIIVQVNGKLRAKLDVATDADAEDIKRQALAAENVVKFVGNDKPSKVIYVPGRLVNIVI